MTQDEFYITFSSDSSIKLFLDDTTTYFMVQLPRRLTFNGKWSVALVEIEYLQTVSYIPNNDLEKKILIYHDNKQYTIELPERIWKDPREIVGYLQSTEFSDHFYIFFYSNDIVTIEMARPDNRLYSKNGVSLSKDDDNYILYIGVIYKKF